jgi:hypothetical protein
MSLSAHSTSRLTVKDVGQRGKTSESEVKKILDELSKANLHFAAHRVMDARSAGGKFGAQAGDFFWSYYAENGTPHGLIEVKEVEHSKLLPYKNLSPESYARLNKRRLAGAQILVLVAHRVPTGTVWKTSAVGSSVCGTFPLTKTIETFWRAMPLSAFSDRSTGGSWDLSAYPVVDFKQVLKDLLKD